ncbi:MAG TPA: bifunctional (p)ppGpp synthetase/guanosine-3',5'-bis(diphosphate) 3'-pyrophosphohydrolase, partial [Microbacterium sp.]|nr:bifunctional (p)ppGpp synthetase/guanosine-3',5'-bis(diphosphate) 3'-pyrophosphohydrolase [Microbacterium sp.]
MTEAAPPAQSTLRRLVPRIFSRAARRDDVETLIRTVRTHHPKSDLTVIERAYGVAEAAHEGQKRQSGEAYITHPLAVAQILAELGLGPKAIAAALLHDTVEDTALSLAQVEALFGESVRRIVEGETK